jgi:7-carboxy-7-deazaguanine synthase
VEFFYPYTSKFPIEDFMKISEIFTSIQGESSFAGLPCTFIRLTGCNLRCHYCDTTYALEGGVDVDPDRIVSRVRESGFPLAELTGGEPLLQEESYLLSSLLLNEGYTVLLETNGSLSLDRVDRRVVKIMDMKCPSSGMSEQMDFNNINYLSSKDEVKFVIGDRADFDWALKIIYDYELLRMCKVLVSPLQQRLAAQTAAKWILEEKLLVRMQLQLHKIIWPTRDRGV